MNNEENEILEECLDFLQKTLDENDDVRKFQFITLTEVRSDLTRKILNSNNVMYKVEYVESTLGFEYFLFTVYRESTESSDLIIEQIESNSEDFFTIPLHIYQLTKNLAIYIRKKGLNILKTGYASYVILPSGEESIEYYKLTQY